MKLLFVRNDDIFELDEGLRYFCDLCIRYNTPSVLGVIPERITKESVDFLNELKTANPRLFDIVQHGRFHHDHSTNQNPKYEFGDNRSFDEQKEDIVKGREIVKQHFGNNLTQGFIPPFHGYNTDTLKIIEELNIPVFSANKKTEIDPQTTLNLPGTLNINTYKSNVVETLDPAQILNKFKNEVAFGKLKSIGVVLHSSQVDELSKLKALFAIIKKYEQNNHIRTVNFQSTLKTQL